MRRLLTAALLLGGLVHAAITSPSGTSVLVSLQATAGLRIEGTTHELDISEHEGELVFVVPLAGVDTGIGLRNRHLRSYLDVVHFPRSELHVARKALQFPSAGKWTESDAPGTLTIHGVSRPCTVHYRAEGGSGGDVRVRGTIQIDMRDFDVEVPSYLGVTVAPAVSIQVDFSLRDA